MSVPNDIFQGDDMKQAPEKIEMTEHEGAIIRHVLQPIFDSLCTDAKLFFLYEMIRQSASYEGFLQRPFPSLIIDWMERVIAIDKELRANDQISEELFSPPKTELDV